MREKPDIAEHNSRAWDRQVESGNEWTVPVGPEVLKDAKKGDWKIWLTPRIPLPRDWFLPKMKGVKILCLASGGGQQGPVLSAAGADVTVFDNSEKQLDRDRVVAKREGLKIRTVKGSMKDLSAFKDGEFDLIVHPVSNVFCDDVKPVWKGAYRVLRPGGVLLSGLTNPLIYIFDSAAMAQGRLEVKHSVPYSDAENLSDEMFEKYMEKCEPFEFSHTLDDLIGGQIAAGFKLTGFFEDDYRGTMPLDKYIKWFINTRAEKAGD
jgi:SAM-dependent methyltransferase